MARPIEPTPPITGENADRLYSEIFEAPPPDQSVVERLRKESRAFLAMVSAPKPARAS